VLHPLVADGGEGCDRAWEIDAQLVPERVQLDADLVERDLVPAVAEIVVEVNRAERRIVIDPPEGLLEL